MAFWTSQELEQNLSKVIEKPLIGQVDCNAYTLRIGDEIYVSPSDQTPDPKSSTIRKLAEGEGFTIPQGQFAFLITEETIRVPKNAMALISMKAKIKFKGLVNVSGFHVDPGFNGRLVFSVFNASPTVVHLKRGQDCFLIWFATLSGGEESQKHKTGLFNQVLSPDLPNALPGELQSLEGLSRKIKDVEKRFNDRLNKIEPKQAALITRLTIYVTASLALCAFFGKAIWDQMSPLVLPKPPALSSPPPTGSTSPSSTTASQPSAAEIKAEKQKTAPAGKKDDGK